jgi:hypothetical protein
VNHSREKSFDVFCDFIQNEFCKKLVRVDVHFFSVPDCLKTINRQYDLFESAVNCFGIRNAKDNHLEKVAGFFEKESCIFLLESDNHIKSKEIAQYFLEGYLFVISSFENELKRHSATKIFFPDFSPYFCDEIVKITGNTNEEFYLFFSKCLFCRISVPLMILKTTTLTKDPC